MIKKKSFFLALFYLLILPQYNAQIEEKRNKEVKDKKLAKGVLCTGVFCLSLLFIKKLAEKEPKNYHQTKHAGMTGLRNLNNTCFMNATLQCLAQTPTIKKHFCSSQYQQNLLQKTDEELQGDKKITQAFAQTIQKMHNTPLTHIAPDQLKDAFKQSNNTVNQKLMDDSQQDAPEFLNQLLNSIKNALKQDKNSPLKQKVPHQNKDNFRYTPQLENLTMIQKSSVSCSTCNNTSIRYEPGQTLQVPIIDFTKDPVSTYKTLKKCLQGYNQPETLEGDNAYFCSTCTRKTTGKKTSTLASVPETLIIQLKRFIYNKTASKRTKLYHTVNFPMNNLSINTEKQTINYHLIGVIHHSGSAEGGHYTASVKSLTDNNWYHCNDSSITPITPELIDKGTAYVLFYQKVPTPAH